MYKTLLLHERQAHLYYSAQKTSFKPARVFVRFRKCCLWPEKRPELLWFTVLLGHTIPAELKRKWKCRQKAPATLPLNVFILIGCTTSASYHTRTFQQSRTNPENGAASNDVYGLWKREQPPVNSSWCFNPVSRVLLFRSLYGASSMFDRDLLRKTSWNFLRIIPANIFYVVAGFFKYTVPNGVLFCVFSTTVSNLFCQKHWAWLGFSLIQ